MKERQVAVRHFPDPASMSRAAADHAAEVLSSGVRRQGYATLVLSGGSTPRLLYSLLASAEYAHKIPWPGICFFWGDERCVPADHPDSNYAMAHEALLSRVPVPGENIYRIPVELGWRESAIAYEAVLRRFYLERSGGKDAPEVLFDLALLGVGEDGHTASLFPGSPALGAQRWVAPVDAPVGMRPRKRITLTPALLNTARQALFLAGAGKQEIVRRIFEGAGGGSEDYPAAKIGARDKVSVFIAGPDARA